MNSPRQRTLWNPVTLEGIGLHSGVHCEVNLNPEAKGKGISFISPKGRYPSFTLSPEHGEGSFLCSILSSGNFKIKTVEHLLSALSGLGIDQLEIEIEAEEIPILDGSAGLIVKALKEAGIRELESEKEFVEIRQPLVVYEGESFASVYPSRDFRVTYIADYGHPWAGPQIFDSVMTETVYEGSIAGARTFGFKKDIEMLLAKGLIKGGRLDNAIVIDESGYSSPLRYPDELIRHKVLDLMGDLYMLARPIRGHVVVFKGGHRLHSKLANVIYRDNIQTKEHNLTRHEH